MAKCIVIGGGFAGLSTAVFLAKNGHHVKLIETSPKLGGRAYSFKYEKQNCIVDNGQHILMGCYNYTLRFLDLIGSSDKIEIQPSLKINFSARGGKKYQLDTEGVTYPFNILSALRNYQALSNTEKVSVIKLFLKIAVANPKHYASVTTKKFLEDNHQSKNTIDALWEIIHVGTMNCKLEESCAKIFIRVLKEIFFTVNDSTKIILPKVGLSEIYCDQSVSYLKRKNCSVSLSERLTGIQFDDKNEKVIAITTSKNSYSDFDFLILAIPPYQCSKILAATKINNFIPEYEYSSILNIHLWLDVNPFKKKFYGLIDSKIHWLFNHSTHLTLVTSAAKELIELTEEELLKVVKEELINFFPEFSLVNIIDYLVIKEKRATFIPTITNTALRLNLNNNMGNIVFAGDWTNTKFPATIEGAVKSGCLASDKISELLKKN